MLESHKDVTLNAAILWPEVWFCDIMKKAHISEAKQMEIFAHFARFEASMCHQFYSPLIIHLCQYTCKL